MWSLLTDSTHTHLGEELSLRSVLRWKREGAKHTARLVQVIWFSPTLAVTSLRKHNKLWRASRFSSGKSNTAALTACRRCSLGTSETDRGVSLVYSEHSVRNKIHTHTQKVLWQCSGTEIIMIFFAFQAACKTYGKPCPKTVLLMVYLYFYNIFKFNSNMYYIYIFNM